MSDPLTRRDQSRETRRAAIVSAARDAFLEHGYAATSMSTIAAQLGGSKGTLWAYFPSKEDLFAAVLDERTTRFRLDLDDALHPSRDCRTTLVDFAERFLFTMLKPDSISLYRLIVGEGGRFPEIGRIFYTHGPQVIRDRLADYIGDRMEMGDLRQEDPMHAALTLIQLIQTQHNLLLWGVVEDLNDDEVRCHAAGALNLFFRAYREG